MKQIKVRDHVYNPAMNLTEARRVVAKADKEKEKQIETRSREAAGALVGKCFKFWNGGNGDHWWLYVRVLGVHRTWKYTTDLTTEEIQAAPNDMHGTSIDFRGVLSAHNGKLDPNYVPITEEEYVRETAKILGSVGLNRYQRQE